MHGIAAHHATPSALPAMGGGAVRAMQPSRMRWVVGEMILANWIVACRHYERTRYGAQASNRQRPPVTPHQTQHPLSGDGLMQYRLDFLSGTGGGPVREDAMRSSLFPLGPPAGSLFRHARHTAQCLKRPMIQPSDSLASPFPSFLHLTTPFTASCSTLAHSV